MAEEHVCSVREPVCPVCGRRWTRKYRVGGRLLYTSEEVMQRYHALYGKPQQPFEPVEES